MKRNKLTWIFSIVISLILLCSSVFVPFLQQTQGRVRADESGKNLYAFVAKQSDKINDGKVYVDFGLSIDVDNDGNITGLF